MNMPECRYDITFTGRVQGVGFRFTTVRIAGGYDVTGWVKSEADGSVRCVAEGTREELEAFIAAIRRKMAGNITGATIQESGATNEFAGFSIR